MKTHVDLMNTLCQVFLKHGIMVPYKDIVALKESIWSQMLQDCSPGQIIYDFDVTIIDEQKRFLTLGISVTLLTQSDNSRSQSSISWDWKFSDN